MISKRWRKEIVMQKTDMSAKAVTTRLKRVSQLRRLGLALQQSRIKEDPKTDRRDRESTFSPARSLKPKSR
jgi:phytoene/squalene synthetase